MLKHSDMIANFSLDEKLAILTSGTFFSAPREGLPTFSVTDTESLNQESKTLVYPSFQALVNTWDEHAVNYVAKQIAKRAMDKEAPAVFLPKANVRSNVYSDGASEDPYLLGKLMGEYAKTMEEYGITPILSTCALSDLDVEYADLKPNAKAIVEYYLQAFRLATKDVNQFAVASTYTPLKGEYEKVNTEFIREYIQRNIEGKGQFLLSKKTRRDGELACLKAGYNLCLNGDARVLKEAVSYHKDLLDLVESGDASVEELETAVADGLAIGEDVIDEAVDGVLDFVIRCNQHAKNHKRGVESISENMLISLAERSVVLLKNKENVLPLRSDQKVAVIGQMALDEFENRTVDYIQRSSTRYIGYEDGYDLTKNQTPQLLASAEALAKRADVILLFLGFDKQREQTLSKTKCTRLPGNQMALLEKLAPLKKKIIAIVKGSGRVDMEFDRLADAVMYAPDMGTFGGQALASLIYGKACPSGRLPFTVYDRADERMQTERFYKNHGYNKVGKFVGYRRYTSDGEQVKYHFGFGLSYTKFQYSNLRVTGGTVQVTVQNVGTREGVSIVQFYYGKTRTADVAPKKELFASEVVKLAAGQAITIRKKLDDATFASYNAEMKKWETVQRTVRIYVGQSVADDRLYCDYNVFGVKEAKNLEDISDYLQGRSNIKVGGYFMDTTTKQGKYQDKITPWGIAAGVLGFLGDLFLLIFAGMLEFFDDIIGQWTMGILIIAFNVLLILGIAGVIVGLKKNADYKKKQSARAALKRKSGVKEKTLQPAPYASLFLREFKDAEEETAEEEEKDEDIWEEESFVIKEETDEYHQENWSLDALRSELVAFLASRGILLDQTNARALLSAMSVSRLLMIQLDKGVNREAFLRALSAFFATEYYEDDASGYTAFDDLLYKNTDGVCEATCFSKVLDAAKDDAFAMKLTHLTNVDAAQLGGYTSQLIRYIVKPDLVHTLTAKNKGVWDKNYALKSNLWILACLEEDVLIDELPAYLAEAAVFVRLQFTETEPQETEVSKRQPVSTKQFLDMVGKARSNFELSERHWKRVDKLEEYVQARAHYRISNKLWQKMENYASVFLALDGESEQALDYVVSSKMLLTVVPLIQNYRKEEDDLFVHVLENIFGDEKSDCCRMLAEATGVDLSEVSRKEELEKAATRRAIRLGLIEAADLVAEVSVEAESKTAETPENAIAEAVQFQEAEITAQEDIAEGENE